MQLHPSSSLTSSKPGTTPGTGAGDPSKKKTHFVLVLLAGMGLMSLFSMVGEFSLVAIHPATPSKVNCPSSEIHCNTKADNISDVNIDSGFVTTLKQQKKGLDEYNICHVENDPLVGYICKGPKYDAFADRLENMVLGATSFKPSKWGRRAVPFPQNSTIIIMGNSHTRQVPDTIRCQYVSRNETSVSTTFPYTAIYDEPTMHLSYIVHHFENNVTVHAVTNHYFAYSPKWQQDLEDVVGIPLSHVDGIILGKFNDYGMATNTSFSDTMSKILEQREGGSLSYPPPTIKDVASVYSGPIVTHSMFTNWGEDMYYLQAAQFFQVYPRDRIRLVNGRGFVPSVGDCGSGFREDIGPCDDDPSAHGCMGSRGGHPDLVAWEIVEAMHELLMAPPS